MKQRRPILLFLVLTIAFLLISCNKFRIVIETTAAPESEANYQVLEDNSIRLTVPSHYEAVRNQEQCDEVVKERGYRSGSYDGVKHEVTYVMSRDQFNKLTFELYSYIDRNSKLLNKSDSYANVQKVEHNEDFSEVTIYTKSKKVGTIEKHLYNFFFDNAKMYNTYWGNPEIDVHVRFVNATTGKLLEESYSNSKKKS